MTVEEDGDGGISPQTRVLVDALNIRQYLGLQTRGGMK